MCWNVEEGQANHLRACDHSSPDWAYFTKTCTASSNTFILCCQQCRVTTTAAAMFHLGSAQLSLVYFVCSHSVIADERKVFGPARPWAALMNQSLLQHNQH